MTQEEIKQTWTEASAKMFMPSVEEFENMYREKKETALEKLAAKYRWFSTLSLIMIIGSSSWFLGRFPFVNPTMRIVLPITMMVYFATCSCIDYWLYRGISSIDCYSMSVKDVIAKALYYKKRHLQSMIFLLPFAMVIVGVMAYSFNSDIYIIYGIAVGFIIGAVLGYRQFLEFMKQYKVIGME